MNHVGDTFRAKVNLGRRVTADGETFIARAGETFEVTEEIYAAGYSPESWLRARNCELVDGHVEPAADSEIPGEVEERSDDSEPGFTATDAAAELAAAHGVDLVEIAEALDLERLTQPDVQLYIERSAADGDA